MLTVRKTWVLGVQRVKCYGLNCVPSKFMLKPYLRM